ncbi:MAG: arginine--tRNA ligase [Gemmatimonadaceae bacterium]|nr:arginine--tRNA ligase [Gemmatimonadaceae bacterium]
MSSADRIREELIFAARELGAGDHVEPAVERPRESSLGDWTTNLAMTLARPLRKRPAEIATLLRDRMRLAEAGIERVDIAGAGFMNFFLDPARIAEGTRKILEKNEAFGRSDVGKGQRVNVEFVSANPTGPLHVGHGRQAALGDAISALLEWTGWEVSREFYYNDAGVQIDNLAASVSAWVHALRTETDALIPDGGYHGEYIREIAEKFSAVHGAANPADGDAPGNRPVTAREFAVAELRKEQDLDLQAFGVKFDSYYLESSLYSQGKVASTVDALVAAGKTYEDDGALFLRTTEYGDDKDRVMRKSAGKGGDFTYFVPDVAYHVTKWERGFRRAIDVQGADHHSTVTRVRAGLQALGMDITQGYPEYVLHQMVTVMKNGEEVKISKRAGSYVTVRDLINEVGGDAVRFFFLMRKSDSQLVFDVDVARKQSEENPVYYVQMAHARMCGIFRVGSIDRESFTGEGANLALLREAEEQELIKALVDFPRTVEAAAAVLEPHRIATYLTETARLAHSWYHKHHVLGEADNVMLARLTLARSAQIVIRNGLRIMGITAPERM